MSNRRLDCDVVCDLIPLYHDGVVSETTRKTIKEHLENCADCRKEYETICTDIPMEPKEMTTKRKFADMMKKVRRKRFFCFCHSSSFDLCNSNWWIFSSITGSGCECIGE